MKYYSILPNYHMAVRNALNYFEEMGYEKIAYVGAVNTYDYKKELTMDARYYYYRNSETMRDTFDEEWVICILVKIFHLFFRKSSNCNYSVVSR